MISACVWMACRDIVLPVVGVRVVFIGFFGRLVLECDYAKLPDVGLFIF